MRIMTIGLAALAVLFSGTPAIAQTSANFGGPNGGSVIPGWDGRACGGGGSPGGAIRYNSSTNCTEYCDGTDWVCPSNASSGYLVQSSAEYNGNLGGIDGANTICLNDLQNNDWLGKSDAGMLSSDRVTAFICDDMTCNIAEASSFYLTAVAGDTTKGGIGFKTDSQGRGIGNSLYFNVDNFESARGFWSNRGTVDSETWGNSPETTEHCTNWTLSSSGSLGRAGNMANNNALRWNEFSYTCDTTRHLLCLVSP